MKTKKILFGSTLLAAAALNFCTASANADTYTWAGTGESASWNTTDSNWTTSGGDDPTAWGNRTSNDATFTDDAESKKVSIEEAISAHTVEITGGSYTFTLGESGSLKANAYLKVDDGASLTVDGSGSVDFVSNATIGENASLTINGGDFTIHGKVTVSDGGSIEITGGDVYLTYTVTINSDATLTVSEGASLKISNTTTVNGGSIEISGGDAWFQNAPNISGGGSLTISGGETRFSGTGTVTVSGEGSSINISDGSVVFNRDVTISDGASIDISGGSVEFSKDVTIGDGASIDISGGSVVFNGSIDLSEGGSINLTNATMIDYNYTIKAQSEKTPKGEELSGYTGFEGIGVMVGGTVTDFTLTGSDGNAISDSNIYITGTSENESSLTITEVNIAASTNKWYGGLEAFIVENATVILDGGVSEENDTTTIDTGNLDMTLCVGTMSDATLEITGGAKITFNGVWNTVGSNLHTGTINISGEGSYLCTQQISIGMVYVSMSSGASVTDGYYFAQYLESDAERDAVVAAVTSGEYTGSYGIINVKDGGTYAVGVGNTNPSNNRLQLSNGEINIDGEGSSMILGSRSSIFMMGENGLYVTDENGSMHIATGVNYTEKIIVTNGGSVVNENGTYLRQAIFGDSFYAANTAVVVSVEGEGSTFDIAVGNETSTYDYALFGSVYGYYKDFEGALNNGYDIYSGDGGSADVSISASDGGIFKVSAEEGIYAALDNAAGYFDKKGDYKGAPPEGETAGHSYGINVEFAATTGGTIELEATNGSDVVLAAGSAATKDASGEEADYKNSVIVKADGTLTDDEGTTTASSVTISGANIYANAHDAENVFVEITATNGGEITLTATGTEEGTPGVILLNQNTTITVEDKSTLNTTGTVTFNAGSSITVNDGGTWTSNGSVIVEEGASVTISTDAYFTLAGNTSMSLNGTIDLSEAIKNSGEITVSSNVAFVLNDSLKVDGTYFTYTFITNTEANDATETPAGTIKGWGDLTADNFVIADALYNLADDIGVVLKADGQATIVFITKDEQNGGTATVDYDYYIDYQRNWDSRYYCIGVMVDGTVDNFVLQDITNKEGDYAIASKNVLFIGSGEVDSDGKPVDSVTITSMNINNGETQNGYRETNYYAFAVEGCTVIIDGVKVDDLGMSFCVGTMYEAGAGELIITNESSITTKDCYSTIGSNLNTGTVTIEEGSTLATQQITIGGGVDSLYSSGTKNGTYQPKYFYTQETYEEDVRYVLVSGKAFEGSYGIVNVESGSTFSVSVGNTTVGYNKFQLSNGELNVDGAGSQMIIGSNSSFLVMGEWAFTNSSATSPEYGLYTGIVYNEKITVTGGGKITNEEGTSLYALYLGEDFLAANTTVEILVSGSDDNGNASTFDLTGNESAHIGAVSGYNATYKGYGDNYIIKDGGTMDVTISASEGGEFKITANGIFVCADNYKTYLNNISDTGHSYGIDVKLSAESGGSIKLNSVDGGSVLLAAGSPLTEEGADGKNAYTNTLTITADGTVTGEEGNVTASSVAISGKNIAANYEASNLTSSYIATNGGSLTLSATAEVVLGYGTATDSSISVQAGIAEDKDNGVGAVSGGTVSISGSVVYANYLAPGLTTNFGAYEGGTLTITAEEEIVLGIGLDPADADNTTFGGSISITADGAGSNVEISFAEGEGNQAIFINYETTDFASTITASDGGSISMSANEVAIGYSDDTSGVSPSGSATITATGTDSTITISATEDISTNTEGSGGLSVAITATQGGTINLIAGETDGVPTPGRVKPFGDDASTTGIYLGKNTTVTVDDKSTLNTTGAVTFDAGSSLSVNAGGFWTSNGSVTVAEAATMSLNGRVDLSETIQNSGAVTVNSDVVFVLNNSLKVEGTSATYALIEGGTITNWDNGHLTTSNFVYSDSALDTNVVLDLSKEGYVTLLYTKDGVTINYDYEVPWLRGDHGLYGYETARKDLYYFRAMHIEIDEGASVGGFTLQDLTNEEGEYAITSKNVYITGSGKDSSKLTITNINVDNSTFPSTSEPYYAFIVENATVVIDGTDVNVSELGMSLCIGTMDSAELQITGGAQVSTGGIWSTIGSNMATGTLTISGEGSSLTNAQINIGMTTTSLSGGADEEKGDGYYFGRFVQSEWHYQKVLSALTSSEYKPTNGSYGIVNVKEGGTWTISGYDTSNSRLQLSNGEINIDGAGSSLIFGENSSLVMGNMTSSLTGAEGSSVTLTVSETLNVINGGSVKNADGVTLHEILIGAIYSGSNGEAAIYVDGEGSTFDLSDNGDTSLYIGEKYETVAGGTEKVTISASNGGTLKLSSAYGINVGYTPSSSNYQQADQMSISLTAESGGTITLAAAENGATYSTYFGRNTATEETSTIDVKATGEGSSVVVSTNRSIWTNYNTSNFGTSFVAGDGGKLTMTSSSDIVFGYGSSTVGSATVTADGGTVTMSGYDIVTNNNKSGDLSVTFTATNGGTMSLTATSSVNDAEGIHLNSNSSIIVENGSTLTTSSAKTVLFESGSSISVDATSTWTDDGTIEVKAGAKMDLAGTETIYDTIDSQGTITVSGGTLDVGSISVTQAVCSGEYDGTFTISGGTVFVETIAIGYEADVAGTFSITSGEIDASSFSIASAASANFSGGIVDVATSIANTGSVTVTNEVVFVLSDALKDSTDQDGNTYIVIATDPYTIRTWQGLSSNNFIFSDGSTLGRAVVDLTTDGVVTITSEKKSATLIWNGTDSLHEWDKNPEDKDWKNGPLDDSFYMGDNVIFNEVAENKDVLIDEPLIAGTITVELSDDAEPGTTADYTFDFDNNAYLIGDTLTVDKDTSLEVTGDGSLKIRNRTNDDAATGKTDIAGDMTVSGNADVSLEDVTVESSGSLSVEDGSVTIAGNENTETTGDFTVHGSLNVSGGSLTADNLTLSKDNESSDGASAAFSGGETTIDGTVTVDSNSSLTVSGGTLTADFVEVEGTLDLSDGGTLNTGDLTIASDENADFSSGNLNIGSLTVESDEGVTFGDGLTVGVYGSDELDLDVDITLDGSVGFDTSNGDIEIKGTISNGDADGSLTKTGEGTLTLDGENTYSGGTTIDEGTVVADDSALGTGDVDIHKGAILKIHSSDSTSENPDEFTHATSGEGTLEITDGDIHFTKEVGVQNVVVDKDATLNGNTTLTHSDASLDLKGTLEISVTGEEYVTLTDGGKVILEETSKLVLDDDPTFKAGDSFVIVEGGTVTGDIDRFLGTDESISTAAESYAVIYDTSNGLSVSISKTGEQSVPYMRLHDGLYSDFIAAVITAEDMTLNAGIQGTGDVSSNPIARELLNGNVSRAIEMLNTLAPNDYAAMIAMPTTAFHNDVSSLDKRLAAVRAMPFSEDENARWGYFAQADGTFADNDDANDTPTFDFQLYGVLAGADYRMSNTLTVGVALGYDHEHAKLHNSGGRIDGDDVRVTVYAGAQLTDTVYANLGAQVGYGYYEARRHTVMGRASGETEGYNAGVFADVGMDLPLSDKLGISARPYVGLAYLRSFVRSFDDNLFDIGSFNNDSLRARVGLGLFWDLDGVSLGIDTSFSHDFCGEEIDDMSATYRATGSKFSMMAECLPEDVFSVGPVVSVGISEGLSAFAGYSFQAGSNEYIGHNVYIGVRASF